LERLLGEVMHAACRFASTAEAVSIQRRIQWIQPGKTGPPPVAI
jgi:hypothetical protein